MTTFQIFRETTLPGTLQAYSFYLVAPAAKPDYVEIYVTGANTSIVKRVFNESDVQALIDASIGNLGALEVVADITARNALSPTANTQALVLDATGDNTVASGAATYVYRVSNSTWTKISEAESLDLSITWSSLQNKPTSSVTDIDDAVSKKHTHTNKTELDKISQDGDGNLTYDGSLPVIAWDSTGW